MIVTNEAQLRKISEEVEDPKATEVRKLIEKMRFALRAKGGVGLAANQIGVLKRVIIWDLPEKQGGSVGYAINPVILERTGEQRGTEGCLSIPGKRGRITRARHILLEGRMTSGVTFTIHAEDHLARVIQHEVDHLNGILWTDHLNGAAL